MGRHLLLHARAAMLAGTLALLGASASAETPTATKSVKAAPATLDLGLPEWGYYSILLLRDPSVQVELKLNTKQVEALTEVIGDADVIIWGSRNYAAQERAERLNGTVGQYRERLRKSLSTAQRTRLDQLVIQARGSAALVAPDVIERLKLSEKQTKDLQSILKDTKTAVERLDKDPESRTAARTQTEQQKLRKREFEQLLAKLTARQRSDVKAMVGAPFDLGGIKQRITRAPAFRQGETWLNSPPLDSEHLGGKVVVVHFWAFGCINCVHNLPSYEHWHQEFSPEEVVIVGIHTPETERERDAEALRAKVREEKIAYPVLIDSEAKHWQAWDNRMWPTVYLVDKQGFVRTWWAGELGWEGARGEEIMRDKIRELLAEK